MSIVDEIWCSYVNNATFEATLVWYNTYMASAAEFNLTGERKIEGNTVTRWVSGTPPWYRKYTRISFNPNLLVF